MTSADDEAREAVSLLRDARTIRERCGNVLAAARRGESSYFEVNDGALPDVAKLVVAVTREAYPDLRVPLHCRHNHFRVGNIDRVTELRAQVPDAAERARREIDLVITSVLLDAGAGPDWYFEEGETGQRWERSEGLAVASFRAFMGGAFARDRASPRADAARLRELGTGDVAEMFRVSAKRPLVGLDGRSELMRRLGAAIANDSDTYRGGRPGGIYDFIAATYPDGIEATLLLQTLLSSLEDIWPGRESLRGTNLGDVWRHPAAGGKGESAGLVPFHKLSQWLCYSLVEPLEAAGLRVRGVQELTGLAEYRNGGLLLDGGVLHLLDSTAARSEHSPDSTLIVEWRALTVALLDEVGARVRAQLGLHEEQFPLAKVLEGGTWAAGRRLAQRAREGGVPPLRIRSDGTVF